MPEFLVEKCDAGARLDHFLTAKIPHLTRSRLQALIKAGHVQVNGALVKAGEKLRAGQCVALTEPPASPTSTDPEDIPLDILFEDEDLLVLNKPPGLVVHPAAGNTHHTLVNALLHHCRTLSGLGGELRPGIVHRLDKETSGCLVVAKNDLTHVALSRQFAGRTVTKIYLALAAGHFKTPHVVVAEPIGRHPVQRQQMTVLARGRPAQTEFRVVQELAASTFLACTLHTGRTHQIRVHLKHLGHPLLGDKLYAPKLAGAFPRQMLHAWQLGFAHPRTGEHIDFCAPLPDDFLAAGLHLPHNPVSKKQFVPHRDS